jgi:hypothetical protein
MKRQTTTERDTHRASGAKVPDKPRDCGPHVDTWPILDTQVGDAPKPKTDAYGKPRRNDSP